MLMALAGYLTFGDMTQGNVLNNFPTNNIMVNVARLCFGLNMLSTLPLEAFVCREVMENYYFPGEPWDGSRHLIFTTTLVTSAMGLSLMTCDLGAVFELIGVSASDYESILRFLFLARPFADLSCQGHVCLRSCIHTPASLLPQALEKEVWPNRTHLRNGMRSIWLLCLGCKSSDGCHENDAK